MPAVFFFSFAHSFIIVQTLPGCQFDNLSVYLLILTHFVLFQPHLHYIHRLGHHHVSTCTHVNKFQKKMTRAKHG